MGMIADRTETRWGKFRPFLLWLALPMGILGVLAFTTPNFTSTGKLIYAYVTYNLLMIAYTAINIPYSSLMGVMSADTVERTSLSSVKFIFAYFGGLIVSGLLVYTKILGGDNEAKGWQLTMGIFGIAAIVFFLITFFTTKERIHPPKEQKTSVKDDLLDLFKNKPWVILLFTGILMILFVSTRMMVTPHYFKYYIADASFSFLGKDFGGQNTFVVFGKEFSTTFELLTWAYNITSQILSLIGTAFAFWFAKNFGKRRSYIGLFAVAVLSTAAVALLKPNNLGILFLLQILGSISGGPLTPLIWAMYADTADYSEYKTGRRATGLVFSASTMSQKIGWALGSFIAGILLSFVGFKPDVVPTESVRNGIKYLISVIPAAAGVCAIILMFFYDLHDRKMDDIQSELAERRNSQ
jgi:GPH family glycoside/pentoside/hexuronide:cation symporter